jgi:acetylornithine deacetylase/succinyl-diaminopimelate desuccinylase-like protein
MLPVPTAMPSMASIITQRDEKDSGVCANGNSGVGNGDKGTAGAPSGKCPTPGAGSGARSRLAPGNRTRYHLAMTDPIRRRAALARPRTLLRAAPFLFLFAFAPGRAVAQQPAPRASADAVAVRTALERLRAENAWTLREQVALCEIPAPPFGEQRRAEAFRARLAALGLPARIDAAGNVIAERAGRGRGPTVMLSGHLDTVFPETTDVRVRREGSRFHGPGIGDDCRGLAVVLAVARALHEARVETDGTILFAGTVGEEGAGNLRGVRHLFTRELPGRVDYFISVDDIGLTATTRAVGSNRYRVSVRGPGGHSYADFGVPNPAHALGRIIARLADVAVPASPRTTFSVGILEGGTSVNAIPAVASAAVDLRSESPAALAALDSAFHRAAREGLEAEQARWPASPVRLTVVLDTIGIRPAGAQPDTASIVRATVAAAHALGFDPPLSAGSTDANLPMSLGVPAVTIGGGGDGGGAHSLEEWYDDGDRGWLGPQWALLLVTRLVRMEGR